VTPSLKGPRTQFGNGSVNLVWDAVESDGTRSVNESARQTIEATSTSMTRRVSLSASKEGLTHQRHFIQYSHYVVFKLWQISIVSANKSI